MKAEGTTPEVSEEFMARVIEGQTQSMIVQRRDTGMGSAGDELRLLALTNLQVSAMEILLKLDNIGGDCTSVRTRLQAGVMLDRIFSIFSTKYDEKCWQASGVLGQSVSSLCLAGNWLF